MMQFLIAMLVVPFLLIGWIVVQHLTRKYAEAHPELGDYREDGGGCGKTCGCKGKSSCKNNP